MSPDRFCLSYVVICFNPGHQYCKKMSCKTRCRSYICHWKKTSVLACHECFRKRTASALQNPVRINRCRIWQTGISNALVAYMRASTSCNCTEGTCRAIQSHGRNIKLYCVLRKLYTWNVIKEHAHKIDDDLREEQSHDEKTDTTFSPADCIYTQHRDH